MCDDAGKGVIPMGKHKRMVQRAVPAFERSMNLQAETRKYGVPDIYELPVRVLWYHRAERLRGRA
ncbi:MAG: hypothetical protein LUQ71_10395 [Methanoregula sp.]|nr:hypothetical protein [Methanoregula sp.]